MSRPTDVAVSRRPDAWWIPAAFLLPAFIVAWGVGVIEAACEAFGDVDEEQATA